MVIAKDPCTILCSGVHLQDVIDTRLPDLFWWSACTQSPALCSQRRFRLGAPASDGSFISIFGISSVLALMHNPQWPQRPSVIAARGLMQLNATSQRAESIWSGLLTYRKLQVGTNGFHSKR
ncbi:hypothetical protein FRB94_007272 [Tulasnella sp. JGI-2019a]|nr:hypothetical protein FRB94_007272 [Tulasnella sp. JGI-2019a]